MAVVLGIRTVQRRDPRGHFGDDLEPPVDGGRDIIVAGDGSGHFRTISDAVAAAVDGDRIEVMPGTYRDSVTITTDISIHGVGARDEVVVEPSDHEPDGDQPIARNYPFSDELVPGWTSSCISRTVGRMSPT